MVFQLRNPIFGERLGIGGAEHACCLKAPDELAPSGTANAGTILHRQVVKLEIH
jgi:hypothetical protein